MSSLFTCISCRVAFHDLEVHRQHYKSDWHRYNLKRKVLELLPVTIEEFQKRTLALNGIDKSNEVQNFLCKMCRKHFSTKNQYENHLTSRKHKEKSLKTNKKFITNEDVLMQNANEETMVSVLSDKITTNENSLEQINDMEIVSDVESLDSFEWIEDTTNPVVNNNCLFCNHHSKSWVRNLKHMTIEHSFFIPDPEYCIDIRGLLIYLGKKIFGAYICIWCNEKGKAFRSAEAVRTHMLDKGHCKMLHEGEALVEYEDFYDYSASYPDYKTADPDELIEIPEMDGTEYQLVLPSGFVIGHRSLMHYYKQSLNPNRAMAVSKNEKLKKVLNIYRSYGWIETEKEAIKKKITDIKYMHRIQQRYSTKLNLKANKLQTHFRQQVNF